MEKQNKSKQMPFLPANPNPRNANPSKENGKNAPSLAPTPTNPATTTTNF
jgi:hypothetical protein